MPPIAPPSLRSPDRSGPSAGAPPPDPTWWEGIKANFNLGKDIQDNLVQSTRNHDAYFDALDALSKLGVDTSQQGPLFDDGATSSMAMTVAGPVYAGPRGTARVLNHDKVFAEMQRQRAINAQSFGGLPATRAEWDQQIATRFGARARDQAVAARAGFVPWALGGAAAGLTDPAQVMTMAVGGGGGTIARFVLGEALAGAAGTALMLPDQKAAMNRMGESFTAADMAKEVALGAAGNVVVAGAGKYVAAPVLGAAVKVAGKAVAPVLEAGLARIIPHLPEGMRPKIRGIGDIPDADLANAFEAAVGKDRMTEAERGAVSTLRRASDEAASNPFVPDGAGIKAHQSALQDALDRITTGTPVRSVRSGLGDASGLQSGSVRAPVAGDGLGMTGRAAQDYVVNRIAGNPRVEGTGKNPASSAVGLGQFVDDTFVNVFRKTFPDQARLGKAAILAQRGTGVERAMLERLTADNAQALARARQPVTPTSLYLAHFLGPDDAIKVLSHGGETPLAGLIRKASINSNASILAGRTVRDAIAFAERKMGGRDAGGGAGSVADGADGADALALEAQRATDGVAAAEADVQAGQAARGPAIDSETAALAQPMRAEEPGLSGESAPGPTLLPEYRDTMPHTLETVPASQINVDAETFQFKSGGDQYGVTDRLANVDQWQPGFSGRVILWQDKAGRYFVADGHQRTGLARRIGAKEGRDISLDAYVLREADGVSARDARTFAAMKNIADESGTITDMAKVLRDAGPDALRKAGVPRGAKARHAEGAARLSPEAFRMVINKVIPEEYGALIGARLPDNPEAHVAMVQLLAKSKPTNAAMADDIVRQGIEAGFQDGVQTDMFGELGTMSSLFTERARVKEAAMSRLRGLKRIFGTAAKEAGTLETAGSKIDVAASRQEVLSNDEALALIDKLAWSAGPVKSAIDRAAKRLADGEPLARVSADLASDIRATDLRAAAMDGADAGGNAGGGGSESPDLFDVKPFDPQAQATLAGFDDPVAEAAQRQADSALHDLDLFVRDNPETMITPDADAEPVPLAEYLRQLDEEEAVLDKIDACLAPPATTGA
ncbi:hypothetical protein [Novosphingobium sp. FKTRR1]|uniref:hypothetical protein n=1 Tax=Novosphingobium sp. FKTRR1 TaxID=2879118 RepID=UPI001CEFC8AA|nr:hypothetical protein [Novosphingobium sp. FKTRR1]